MDGSDLYGVRLCIFATDDWIPGTKQCRAHAPCARQEHPFGPSPKNIKLSMCSYLIKQASNCKLAPNADGHTKLIWVIALWTHLRSLVNLSPHGTGTGRRRLLPVRWLRWLRRLRCRWRGRSCCRRIGRRRRRRRRGGCRGWFRRPSLVGIFLGSSRRR